AAHRRERSVPAREARPEHERVERVAVGRDDVDDASIVVRARQRRHEVDPSVELALHEAPARHLDHHALDRSELGDRRESHRDDDTSATTMGGAGVLMLDSAPDVHDARADGLVVAAQQRAENVDDGVLAALVDEPRLAECAAALAIYVLEATGVRTSDLPAEA